MERKTAVFAFYSEEVEELKDRFDFLERGEREIIEYQPILHLEDVLEIMEGNSYGKVYLSSVVVFDSLNEFFYFSEVVLGNGAHYYIDQEEINSEEMYPVGAILEKIGDCFN